MIAADLVPSAQPMRQGGGQAPEPLDSPYILALFAESLGSGIEDYLRATPGISPLEGAILVHLRHVYNDSRQTVRIYAAALCEFFNLLGQPAIEDIHPWQIDSYLHHLKARELKPATIANRAACVRSFFRYYHQAGLIPRNPAALVKQPKSGRARHGDRCLSIADRDKLLQHALTHCDIRDYLILKTLAFTGVRAAELTGMTWSAIFRDLRGRAFVRVLGKGSRERDVYLQEKLAAEYMIYRQHQFGVPAWTPAPGLQDFPIFPTVRDASRPLSTDSVRRIVKSLGQAALGIAITPHWLRHSFATHVRLKGGRLEDIKKQLGHESITTTMVYEESAHFTDPAGAALEEDLE
jgi:site-specific recombinase XerD